MWYAGWIICNNQDIECGPDEEVWKGFGINSPSVDAFIVPNPCFIIDIACGFICIGVVMNDKNTGIRIVI
jgi:hypothetical protein